MKKLLVFITFFITLSFHIKAQQILWDQCNGLSDFNNIIEDSSGNIYLFTDNDTTSYPYHPTISKYDKDIQLQWSKNADSSEYFIKYIENDGSYFSVYTINDSSHIIRKHDGNRNLIWQTDTIKHAYFYSLADIKKTKQNNYLFILGNYIRSIIICTDQGGNFKWQKDFFNYNSPSLFPPYWNYVFDFIENEDKSLLTIENFYTLSDGTFGLSQEFLTLKSLLDSNGSILKADTSSFFPTAPSNFAIDGYIFNYPVFKQNTSKFYPEFYSTLYYNKEQLVFKVSDSFMNIVNIDTIENYIPIEQENIKMTETDSSYFLLARFINNHHDTVNSVQNGQIEFRMYNIKGGNSWNYTTPFYISLSHYGNAIIYQLSEKKFLVELNDPVTKKIYRLLFEDFQVKWSTVSDDSIPGNNFIYHAVINSDHGYNLSNNPSSNFNNGNETMYYKLQSFLGTDDSGYVHQISYAYGINLLDGSVQKYMRIDSFALPKYYYPTNGTYYYDTYYAVNFFKVLPDNKLFLPTVTDYKCNPGIFDSYLAILGQLNTSVKNSPNPNSFLKIYPNPNHGSFTIDFECKGNENISLHIFDISGRIIYRENRQHRDKTEFYINETNLAKGIYWIRLSQGDTIYSRPFVVQ